MNKLATLFLGTALFAGAQTHTFVGTITDSMCLMDHKHMGATDAAKCVRDCVKSGNGKYKYVLFDGKKAYTLSDQQTPEKFAAQKVKITGTLFEKTGIIKVDKIEAAK